MFKLMYMLDWLQLHVVLEPTSHVDPCMLHMHVPQTEMIELMARQMYAMQVSWQ